MTSRFGNRATGVAAATAIVLLVLLIVLLWTGVGQDFFQSKRAEASRRPTGANGSAPREAFEDGSSAGTGPEDSRRDQPKANQMVHADSREYVRPMKISPLGLNKEDLLYGSDQVQNGNAEPVQLRHHSGHFRHRTANIWDPHPIYEFTAFQKDFLLVLEHDSGFASPDLKVTHIWRNSSTRRLPNIKSNGCFYKGYVKGDPSSSVAVSLCHGMTGNIRTSTGNYFIEPFEITSDHAKPMEHVIYEMSKAGKNGKDLSHCGLDDYESLKFHVRKGNDETQSKKDSEILFDYETGDRHHSHHREGEDHEDYESVQSYQHKRSRRSPSEEYFVEMLVVADSSMANYHGSNTENYILALMYIVSGIFKDASIGNPITIAVVKLEIHYELSFVKYRYPHHDGVSAAEMLREFCHDQALKNDNNEDSPFHHDTALLLTRENICRNASAQKCETLGLAELGTMCDKRSSCSLVQDNGLSAAFTIAHELGHVFNMPHDDAELKCQSHPSSDSISHVMSTSLKEGTDPWSWSECSRHFITEFLESRHSFCLRDRPVKDIIKENVPPDIFPGETIVGNRQCELLYGPGSRICSFMPVCSALWCNKIDSDGCQTLHMPWGDGTPCGEGAWCQKGVCVEKNRKALKKVDGGWGEWEPYGSCSRTCGGGVKKSYRYCDSPRPQNGGSYCIGKRVQYKSCGTKNCPEQSRDFRQEQCSAFDNNNHNIHGIPVNVTWVPKYGLLNDDRCVLYCRPYQGTLYYPLKDKVIDGTPCAPDLFDICVNGQCKPAGCDHVLNSKAKLDLCGKCNGSNDTCRLMTGTFNESATEQGSRFVVNIPAGSSNLDIRQYGMNGTRDDNYLVLKDGVTKDGLLNNKNVLTTFRKMIVYDGVTLEYTGCLKAVERINASRPLRKALLVEVLSVGNLTPPNISYQYTVPLNNLKRFLWRHLDDEWESCDKVCKGRRKRKIVCVSVHTNEVVEDDFCRNSKQLSPIYEPCNMGCTLKWEITARSECSRPCGPGIRIVTKECIQEIVGDPKPYTVGNSACAHLPNRPRDFEECEGLCSSVDWEYSEWSECSKSCGSGTHIREAFCVDKMRNQHVEEERCDPVTKVVEEVCQTQSCPTWSTGEWSECSVTCGIGKRVRDLWCQHDNQVIKMSYCDANTMPKREDVCMRRCTFWSSLEWSPCSVTCGPGKKRRITVCKNHEGKTVDNSECRIKEKPSEFEKCYLQPCPPPVYNAEDNSIPTEYSHRRSNGNYKRIRNEYPRLPRWQISEWSSCSVTCGTGYQKRKVQCVASNSREANMCNPHREPNSTRTCVMPPCPSQLKWVEGEWSPCTKSCGKGTQQRQVLCSNTAERVYLKDEDCSHLGPKPDVEKVCWMTCKHRRGYKWKYEKWSPCSKTCGLGENVRQVTCMNVTMESNEIGRRKINGSVVDDRFCRSINRRRDRKKCERKLCSHTWVEGEWSECSSKCGIGSQSRNVTCHQVNSYGWLDPMPLKSDRACDSSVRPSSIRDCPMMNCKSPFYWSPEEWQECTQPCGRKGIQRRTYKCRDREGKIRKKTDCSGLNKPPPKSKPCNRRLCGMLSCKEVQLHTNARSDGEYKILVGGKNMSIYCKGMNTASPEEYLTLHYPDDNYSEYYDERLINLSACQNNGTRADSCNCVMENRFGTTNFQKVRLIVETLQIRTDDFTFARSRGRPVPLGEAGDCCCKKSCPQGTFRINLEGTSLQVSRMERWVMKTFETLDMRIEGLQISGRCVRSGKSGTCGSCGPSTAGRLKLDVVPP